MAAPNDIILYYYPFSPYAKKVTNYLALRGIEYGACIQPVVLPRNDLNMLGVQYRRIPLLSIGRDVYADTRLIIQKLEERFPNGLGSSKPSTKGLERLVVRWMTDAGIFMRAAGLIPAESPTLKDPKFLKDRTAFTGRTWSTATQAKGRPESIAHMMDAFDLLETTLLAESEWIEGGKEPTLVDVEAQWIFEWLMGMPGALPNEFEGRYPKVFAWVRRLSAEAKKKGKKPAKLDGEKARDHILAAKASDQGGGIDAIEPTGLKIGDEVEVYPIDSGFSHKDVGKLVALNAKEIAIEVESQTPGKSVVLHTPRWGFRVQQRSISRM